MILSPYLMLSKAKVYSDWEAIGALNSDGNHFVATGFNVKYSPFGPGWFEFLILAGISSQWLASDWAFGPSLGLGAYLSPLPQVALVFNIQYTLVFGGERHLLGDGGLVTVAGLSFRF